MTRDRFNAIDDRMNSRLGTVKRPAIAFTRRAITFLPFGASRTKQYQEQINWGQPHADGMRFAGHWRDFMGQPGPESDHYIDSMHARNYDPGLGRFLSVDPIMHIEKNLSEPQRCNRYVYVTNNPLKFDDPDGRERRIMVLSVVEPGRMGLDSILNRSTTFGFDSGYDVQAMHSLGAKSLLHALTAVDGTGTDIPVLLTHGGRPLVTETGGGPDGSGPVGFGAREIAAAIGSGKAQAIVLAACGSMDSAGSVANQTSTAVFGITHGAGASSRELGRSGAVLADVYAATGNVRLAIAVANRMLTRRECANGVCGIRPQWHYVEPDRVETPRPK